MSMIYPKIAQLYKCQSQIMTNAAVHLFLRKSKSTLKVFENLSIACTALLGSFVTKVGDNYQAVKMLFFDQT